MSDDPMVVFRDHLDARIAPKEAPEPKATRPRRRAPAPANDGQAEWSREPEFVDESLDPIVQTALATISPEGRAAAPTVENVYELPDISLKATFGGDDKLFHLIKDLRGQISELKAELIESKHQLRELLLIQESLRVSTRGESGRDGARGVPGRDGQQGPIGPRGERGEKGLPAPRVAAWEPDPDKFTITPVYTNGSKGPPIVLLGLFPAFDAALQDRDDDEWAEASRESRVLNEVATSAARWAK